MGSSSSKRSSRRSSRRYSQSSSSSSFTRVQDPRQNYSAPQRSSAFQTPSRPQTYQVKKYSQFGDDYRSIDEVIFHHYNFFCVLKRFLRVVVVLFLELFPFIIVRLRLLFLEPVWSHRILLLV